MRIAGAVGDPGALSVGGQATITASTAPVDLAFTTDGEWVTGTLASVEVGQGCTLVLVDGAPTGTDLPAGAWVLADGRALRLTRRTPVPPADPERLDGLGRAMPVASRRTSGEREAARAPQALVTEHGILAPDPGLGSARACGSWRRRQYAAGRRSAHPAATTA